MRRTLLLFVLACLSGLALAQPYGNEWINYSRPYWKFKITTEGLCRIESTARANWPAP